MNVPASESAITYAHHYEINGVWAWPEWAHLRFGPFGELHLGRPNEEAAWRIKEPYEKFLSGLTLDDTLAGTDLERGMYVLPVSRFEAVAVVGSAPKLP
jgi:hypothetical protein